MEYFAVNEIVAFCANILMNSTLLWAILSRSQPAMAAYSKILLVHVFSNFAYSIADLVGFSVCKDSIKSNKRFFSVFSIMVLQKSAFLCLLSRFSFTHTRRGLAL